ncbi:hypothetical protein ALQ32_200035 [Pseudomonas syringae pv. tagetis]|uniref:Omega-protein n=1 Tax=Pseudomonas syringae pv. tagetis TaxID=129140 RepID=A0A3M3ZFN7_9PSED|nr:hypothetical protein ALQ32_200035 [Pseudomonas syringae pv. tagetis]
MIARELIEYCGYRGPIQRLWLSALNEASIRQALNTVKQGSETYPLYLSALARSRADWLIGMNFSRLFTLLGRQAGYTGVLSVGRVQTPTLRLVVDRDREISNFIPKPFWSVEVQLWTAGQSFLAKWVADEYVVDEEGRCLDQSAAAAALAALKNSQAATTVSVDTKRGKDPAPIPFDLSTLQEVCSAKFGMGVQETLDVAQSLYETHKATTYPRTDCGYRLKLGAHWAAGLNSEGELYCTHLSPCDKNVMFEVYDFDRDAFVDGRWQYETEEQTRAAIDKPEFIR